MTNGAEKVAKLWGERARETPDERTKLISWDCHPCTMAYINRRISGDTNIYRAIEKVQPDEIYNLGAQSFVPLSFLWYSLFTVSKHEI